MLKKTKILGVGVTTENVDKILEYIVDELNKAKERKRKDLPAGRKVIIFTPNPEQISAASASPSLKSILNEATIALPDGVGVIIGSRLTGKPIEARITGIDFMQKLASAVAKQPVNTGYFGGQPGIAEKAADCLQKSYPELTVSYTSDVYDKKKMIESDIDILFVALGFPKQEKWIIEHKDEIPASVIMAVGGSFDFLAGVLPRAPKFMRLVGLEWLFRLAIQPQRFGRQLRIWHFGGLIFLEALGNRLKKPQNNV